jgi:pyruvate formate-lyase/glycerol dehydratase family glycyl radical enzyme
MKGFREKVLAQLRKPEVCPQRAFLLTESYKETEGQPAIIRRARGFAKILNEIDIRIEPWQLIVGNFASKPFSTSAFPEYSWRWMIDEIEHLSSREGDKFLVSDKAKERLLQMSWWEGKSIQDKVMVILPEETKKQLESGVISSGLITSGIGQYLPGYEKVLKRGFSGIKEDILDRLKRLDISNPDDFSKKIFYESLLIICDAVIHFADRYARLALEMSRKTASLRRKRELREIAEVCKRVPTKPASTFHEAIQCFWFLHLLAYMEIDGAGIAAGRLDQYLYPYFHHDLTSGNLTRSKAKEILRSLWINFNQILTFYPEKTTNIWAGYPMTQQPTLGGIDGKGKDAINELSWLILEVEDETRLPQPDIAVIYHKNIDRDFFKRACMLLPYTMKPKFFNYGIALKHLLEKNTHQSVASNFSNIGCVTVAISGTAWGPTNYGFVNLAKCLELALNNGQDPLRNKKVGLETGDNLQFKTFKSIWTAYCSQIEYAVQQLVVLSHSLATVHKEYLPLPYASIMVDDCILRGKDVTSGGAHYNIPGIQAVGIATVADGLYALEEIVFKRRMISLAYFGKVLKGNFSDDKKLYKIIQEIPKYGNDVEEVDLIARQVGEHFCGEVKRYKSLTGAPFSPALYSISAHAGLGDYVGATPDGRKAREPLADGISPGQGRCLSGPTAAIKSICRINHLASINGTLLNMKFNASMIQDQNKLSKFMPLIDTFMELGGYHVQFNIIDTEMLREAQKYPDKYPDLLVRVAAYVAQFAVLPKKLQDDIIARSELGR